MAITIRPPKPEPKPTEPTPPKPKKRASVEWVDFGPFGMFPVVHHPGPPCSIAEAVLRRRMAEGGEL